MKVKKILVLVLCMIMMFTLANTYAATYPEKTIQIIVNKAAGGGTDTVARMIAAALEKKLGTSVVVLNKEGGEGVIGANESAKAKADGYTLAVHAPNELTNMLVNGQGVAFTRESFNYISSVNIRGMIFAMKKGSQFNSLDELIEYAKANPKKITIGIPGEAVASIVWMLMNATGLEFTIVNAQSGGELFALVLGGHIEAALIGAQFYDRLKDGNCPVLAQTVESRKYGVADVPTFSELGINGVEWDTRMLLTAPAGTPQQIIDILSDAIDKSFADGSIVEMLEQGGETPLYIKGEELVKYLDKYFAREIPLLKQIKEDKNK